MPSALTHIAYNLPPGPDRHTLAAALVALEACDLALAALRHRCVSAQAASALEEASFWLVEEVAPILRHAARAQGTVHTAEPVEYPMSAHCG